MRTHADRYEPGKFNKPKFGVIKRNRHAGEKILVFCGENQAEAEERMRELNAKLNPEQKEEFEYLCEPQGPSYRTLIGPY